MANLPQWVCIIFMGHYQPPPSPDHAPKKRKLRVPLTSTSRTPAQCSPAEEHIQVDAQIHRPQSRHPSFFRALRSELRGREARPQHGYAPVPVSGWHTDPVCTYESTSTLKQAQTDQPSLKRGLLGHTARGKNESGALALEGVVRHALVLPGFAPGRRSECSAPLARGSRSRRPAMVLIALTRPVSPSRVTTSTGEVAVKRMPAPWI